MKKEKFNFMTKNIKFIHKKRAKRFVCQLTSGAAAREKVSTDVAQLSVRECEVKPKRNEDIKNS